MKSTFINQIMHKCILCLWGETEERFSPFLNVSLKTTTCTPPADLRAPTSGISCILRSKWHSQHLEPSFMLESWCAVRRTSRAHSAASERLLPCFCSVTVFPSRSSRVVPTLPTPQEQDGTHVCAAARSFSPRSPDSWAWCPSLSWSARCPLSIHSRLLSFAVLASLRSTPQTEEQCHFCAQLFLFWH